MAASLVKHGLIKTTLPKAKELRRVAEPLITMSKTDGVANRRLAFSRLRDKEAVGKLFVELGPRYQSRPGGYLRVLKRGFRDGEPAPLAYVEPVHRPHAAAAYLGPTPHRRPPDARPAGLRFAFTTLPTPAHTPPP